MKTWLKWAKITHNSKLKFDALMYSSNQGVVTSYAHSHGPSLPAYQNFWPQFNVALIYGPLNSEKVDKNGLEWTKFRVKGDALAYCLSWNDKSWCVHTCGCHLSACKKLGSSAIPSRWNGTLTLATYAPKGLKKPISTKNFKVKADALPYSLSHVNETWYVHTYGCSLTA